MQKSKIIAFAGLDGSGKSTQINDLKIYLETKGIKVKVNQHFQSEIGRKCKEIIKLSSDPLIRAITFALDEYSQITNEPEYDIILCDRSYYCALAYSGTQGISISWLKSLYKFSRKYDFCIYLDISPTTSLFRKGFDNISPKIQENELQRVRENYLKLVETGELYRIDAEQDFKEVTQDIRRAIKGVLGKCT